jgi:PAS domain-containing protein
MSIWGKRTEKETCGRGVARAALDGASREELVREAQKSLAKEGKTGRIGVWLEPDPDSSPQKEAPAAFRGMVLDRGSEETPQEWATLSVEPPLPEELLLRGKTVEQDLDAFPPNPITGALVGLRRASWVPIKRKEQLRGIILAGSLDNQPSIFRKSVESVAAELALALGLEEEQRIARQGNADLGVVKRFLRTPAGEHSPDTLLRNLVESCTVTAAGGGGPGATFAIIGALRHPYEPSGENLSMEFLWHSGDEFWIRAIQGEPLASLWRRALRERRVVGSASEMSWTRGSVDQIVVFPLESEGQLAGTLVAGLPGRATSLATFERLELRAVLAASALRLRTLKEEESQRASRQQTLLECINEPLLVLDEAGRIAAASRGARELAPSPPSKRKGPGQREIPSVSSPEEFFRAGDRERVEAWVRAALDRAPMSHDAGVEPIRAELHNGANVRLRLAKSTHGPATVILLESLAAGDSTGQALHAGTELQNVIEWLEEGVVLFDTQDNIRAINTRFEQMAGLAPEESGRFETLEALLGRLERHAADPARFAQRWRELARTIEGGVREEVQMTHPSPRILERSARPVLDPLGRLLGRVEIYRDLTAQRAFQSKLLQTEKLAALGQMVSGIAHELSNPLTTIVGYAHRLLARPDAPGRAEEVRQIYQEAERAGTILRQLLLNAKGNAAGAATGVRKSNRTARH